MHHGQINARYFRAYAAGQRLNFNCRAGGVHHQQIRQIKPWYSLIGSIMLLLQIYIFYARDHFGLIYHRIIGVPN